MRILSILLLSLGTIHAAEPQAVVKELVNPHSIALGPDGRVYVSVMGEVGRKGDGAVVVVENGKAVPFIDKLDDPRGIAFHKGSLLIADGRHVYSVDARGKRETFAGPDDFPQTPKLLGALAVNRKGVVFVADSGDADDVHGGIYRKQPGQPIRATADTMRTPAVKSVGGLMCDTDEVLLLLDTRGGDLHQLHSYVPVPRRIESNLVQPVGLTDDRHGGLYVGSHKQGKPVVVGIPRPGAKPVVVASGFQSVSGLSLDAEGRALLVVDPKAGTLWSVPPVMPGHEVDESPMKYSLEPAFPALQWAGLKDNAVTDPVVVTHSHVAGRLYVGMRDGTVHVFPNDPKADKTTIFLDIKSRVDAKSEGRDGGLLGLTFPKKPDGGVDLLVYYASKDKRGMNVVHSFPLDRANKDRANVSEGRTRLDVRRNGGKLQGGGLVFGPDGMMYLAVGAGQEEMPFTFEDFSNKAGTILRLDLAKWLTFNVPDDNPFRINTQKKEIWATGFSNVRTLSFDRRTDVLWAADNGRTQYRTITRVVKGLNHGWPAVEGFHHHRMIGGPKPVAPIREHRCSDGTSIVGGFVYRGRALPDLYGAYLYGLGDTVRALWYDEDKHRVTADRPVVESKLPLVGLGEDEAGEALILTTAKDGRCLHRLKAPGK